MGNRSSSTSADQDESSEGGSGLYLSPELQGVYCLVCVKCIVIFVVFVKSLVHRLTLHYFILLCLVSTTYIHTQHSQN